MVFYDFRSASVLCGCVSYAQEKRLNPVLFKLPASKRLMVIIMEALRAAHAIRSGMHGGD